MVEAENGTGMISRASQSRTQNSTSFAKRQRNSTFRVAAAQNLPYPDQTFDTVLCCLALHHIPPDQQHTALVEMRRVLKIGGTLLTADFRPPRRPLTRRLLGALGGHALSHNPISQLPDRITTAGLRITGQADYSHWLHSITATRP